MNPTLLSYWQDPDTTLMLRVQGDEEGPFSELVLRYRARVFARFYRIFQDSQEAEDMTQEVFLRLFRARKQYSPRAKFSTWLFHIAQNVMRNALRSRRRHSRLHFGALRETEESFGQKAKTNPDQPFRRLERLELAGVVRLAVSELDYRQRTALEMHQFQNRSYAEIAAVLALTPKAAKSLLYRARLHLRAHLDRFRDVL